MELLLLLQAAHHEFALNFNPANPYCQGEAPPENDNVSLCDGIVVIKVSHTSIAIQAHRANH